MFRCVRRTVLFTVYEINLYVTGITKARGFYFLDFAYVQFVWIFGDFVRFLCPNFAPSFFFCFVGFLWASFSSWMKITSRFDRINFVKIYKVQVHYNYFSVVVVAIVVVVGNYMFVCAFPIGFPNCAEIIEQGLHNRDTQKRKTVKNCLTRQKVTIDRWSSPMFIYISRHAKKEEERNYNSK